MSLIQPAHRGRLRSGRPSAARGFTLIEILVVLVIIGILAAGVLLSLNSTGQDPQLQKESDRLLALFNYAREQAELQTREYGLLLQPDSYEFLAYDVRTGLWRSVDEDDVLRLRKLPAGLDFKLVLDGRPVVLQPPPDTNAKQPQVMIFSDGDLDSFEITLEREGGGHSVTIDLNEKGEVVAKPMVEASST